jgi:hypothetical protein
LRTSVTMTAESLALTAALTVLSSVPVTGVSFEPWSRSPDGAPEPKARVAGRMPVTFGTQPVSTL